MKKMTMPVIAMLLATAYQTPSFADADKLVSRVYSYKPPNEQQLRCLATCFSYPELNPREQQVKDQQEWFCSNGYGDGHCWGSCNGDGMVQRGPCSNEKN